MKTESTKQVDREAEIAALGRAIVVERKARYTNLRGRKSTFAEFMRRTAEKLSRRFPQDVRWATIRGLYYQYPNIDLASRIAVLHRTEQLLIDATGGGKSPPNELLEASSPLSRIKASGNRPPGDSGPDSAERTHFEPQVQSLAMDQSPISIKNQTVTAKSEAIPAPTEIPTRERSEENVPGTAVQASKSANTVDAGRKSSATGLSKAENLPVKSSDTKKSMPAKVHSLDPQAVDVKYVRGVGPKMAEMLSRLNIHSAEDLLRHYPRQHLDFQNRSLIKNIKPGEQVAIFGTIRSVGAFQSKNRNISIISILINDGTGSISVSRFIGGRSNKFLLERYKNSYPKGSQVMACGRAEEDGFSRRLQLKNAEVEVVGVIADGEEELNSLHVGRLVPIYSLVEGLSLKYLRSIIHNALEAYAQAIVDPLPEAIRVKYDLLPLSQALWAMHFPTEMEQKERGRRRLVFDELFLAQVQLAERRHRFKQNQKALSLPASVGQLLARFREALPFKLTGAQDRVFEEIAGDLASPNPMHRLVQGDVGSGKTVVAAMASLIAIENGYQVAIMAPTEILAEQHYRQFERWLSPLGLRCGLLLGKQGVKERRQIQQDLLSGQINVAIGTHALIQDDVEFNKLGFVVIDEQHRFGVKQRARLKAKGISPELLTMTATPIPRTLALTMHGDLDVSEIDELPPGRKPIETELIGAGQKRKLYGLIKEQIVRGRQAYIVFPLIEESETLAAKAATVEYEKLRTEIFPELKIGLMHGKLKPQEKDEVMEQFRDKKYDILVSTTVIEVGVDVPNASVMVIENADRFGLAQLHQLRGRVGRGAEQSYCYLVADARSEVTKQRLGIMTQTNDGFVVAEKDLELRGPGEFLGVRQSGIADLLLADIVQDAKILEEARQAAIELVKADPELTTCPRLAEMLAVKRVSERADLIASG